MKLYIIVFFIIAGLSIALHQAMSMEKNTGSGLRSAPGRTAVFAGGCFWCTEADFEKINGVLSVVSGYTGGGAANPTYDQVSAGGTGHVEAVRVTYDPETVSYEELLDVFWRHVDPTDPGGQFVDRGEQYRSVIFYADEQQREAALASKKELAETGPFKKSIVTDILPLGDFYPAEEYHQDYADRNPIRYRWYRGGSGRDQFLEKIWADSPLKKQDHGSTKAASMKNSPPVPENRANARTVYSIPQDDVLKKTLSPIQYKVTRENGTEPPFDNPYWNHHEDGIYVDIVSGEPLFSSVDKFDSGTGWPSFTRPLEPGNIVEKIDRGFFMTRTEVRSKHADSHLGHLFTDGPEPTGLRYCINSAALRFIAKNALETTGHGKYLPLFTP